VRSHGDIASIIGFHQPVDRYVAMPGPSVTGTACPRSNCLRFLVALSGIALTPPQFNRLAHVSVARPVRRVFFANWITASPLRSVIRIPPSLPGCCRGL
jgi:hypothetical protein